jgi:biopolymer transport protein ExbB/TolQ
MRLRLFIGYLGKGRFNVSKSNNFALAIVRMPFLWGGLTALGFYTLIYTGILHGEQVYRYFDSHPVEHISMTLFFIGVYTLIFKAFDIAAQFTGLSKTTLGTDDQRGVPIEDLPRLRENLKTTTGLLPNSYLVRRLHDALDFISRKGSADALDEHLRYAADIDAGRMHSSYALMRIIIWAIPILGFLGTVLGITIAIAELGGQEDLGKAIPAVIAGLKVAFDTTALALFLSMVLMFAQFVVDRVEGNLLGKVDDKVNAELVGRFEDYGNANDPEITALRRMADSVVQAGGKLVQRQAELWRVSIDEAHKTWALTAETTGKQLQESLRLGLGESLQQHAASISNTEAMLVERRGAEWNTAIGVLRESTSAIVELHSELARQGQILLQVKDATGQIQQLETALNNNLATLAGAHNFEETVVSLAAAIQLLTSHLHTGAGNQPRVELKMKRAASSAA